MKIKTIPINTSEEPYASLYQSFLSKGLTVPAPLQLASASAPLFNVYRGLLAHYYEHGGLNPLLMGCIRYTTAWCSGFDACIKMNREILARHGETDLTPLENKRPLPTLDETATAIYEFAVDSLFHPKRITEGRILEMQRQGVSDALMFDAAFHGALLLMMGPLVKSFG